MSEATPRFVRVGLRKRARSVRLRLRWDRSPRTCRSVLDRLPIDNQVWHAKYANNEVFTLVPMFGDDPGGEWRCMYPGPGDLMYIPVDSGFFLPPGAPPMDRSRGIVDIAYFYERGNSLWGPSGPAPGNIFATAHDVDELERFAQACSDVWFAGATGESLYVEADPEP